MMEKKTFNVKVNDVDFYCEMSGNGPTIVLIPDGSNDCERFDGFSKLLSDKFTVLTFDTRGGSRSMDFNPKPITPKILADDVAGIIKELDLGPATIYGCSSGGQAALSVGKYHPDVVRNIIVHEAAFQVGTPLPNTGFDYFKNISSFEPYLTETLNTQDIWAIGNAEKALGLGVECRTRIKENKDFWAEWYLGSVDLDVYTEEDLKTMPPTEFTVGTWSPAWLVYANIETAKRGNCPVKWFSCAHHPELICPEEYTQYMRKTIGDYL